ncbi:hypothetical protein [Mesoflavibacter zeaxanthinifaciens]|uniref:hypothetical protein n=1 Tax=Mesoflavibacter zeaxanthinifaciens TaxID=393060 RepID=UPI0026F15149|nr:hypothetical protein [Mesoflavibacter zeaxanthinifaciens]
MNNIENAKKDFLDRYNPNREIKKALELSIKASVQRNPTYSNEIETNSKIRKDIILFWKEQLAGFSKNYKDKKSLDTYFQNVIDLKNIMNSKFTDAFNHSRYINDKGFRIAHSQKSLSVYLKHLWCLGLISEPPMCPIDNIILTKIGLKYPQNKWGYINTEIEFKMKSNLIISYAEKNNLSVCKWELLVFQNNNENVFK